jgi:anaerobic selenocysteine-containing dehydrogenase
LEPPSAVIGDVCLTVAVTDQTVLTTCPRDCYDACGILVTVRDGAIRSVRGDPGHPVSRGKLCRKCSIGYNGVFLDPDARLTTPLRRVGAKGEGRFEPISWDAAMAEIASRWGAISEQVGPEAILNAHYTGTCSVIAYAFGSRFFRRLGATEVDPDSVCNKAGHVALDYMYGSSVTGFDPRSARHAECIMVWGANPSASAPHAHDHWLPEAAGTVIVVDSIRTPTAQQADLHLQPFPGSDAALAFAMLHVIARDGLADRELLEQHAIGWDELEPRLEPCTPEWAEPVTGVPAHLIERAAAIYGRGPSLLWIGQGLQRQPTGGNVMRAVALLPAVSGNLAKRGAGFLYLNDRLEIDEDWLTAPQLGDPPEPISHMDLAACLEDPARSRSLFCWNINIAASNPEQSRLLAALGREDLFTVVVDLFATDTGDYADLLLPAASFLEFDDLVASYFDLSLSAQVKAVDPVGEALPNQEIFRRLATAMGFTEPELHAGDREMIDAMLAQSGVIESFEQLAAAGTVPLTAEPVVQFADLEFETASGRIEIASAAAEADGHPRLPQPWSDPRPAADRLRLLSPASPWLMNDSFANDRKITKRMGRPSVTLHPADAASRGLGDGDMVRLSNASGTLELAVAVSDIVPQGVAYSPKGRWLKREQSQANVNVLNDGRKADFGASTSVHGVEVTAERV